MKPLTLQQIRRATGAKPLTAMPAGDAPAVEAVCTNTREMLPSSVFVALRGDRFDAHDYLADAHAGGAMCAIIEREPSDPPPGMHLMLVPDTYAALGKI